MMVPLAQLLSSWRASSHMPMNPTAAWLMCQRIIVTVVENGSVTQKIGDEVMPSG